jgi:hypothetical protein
VFLLIGTVFAAIWFLVFWIQPLAAVSVIERFTPNILYRVRTSLPLGHYPLTIAHSLSSLPKSSTFSNAMTPRLRSSSSETGRYIIQTWLRA